MKRKLNIEQEEKVLQKHEKFKKYTDNLYLHCIKSNFYKRPRKNCCYCKCYRTLILSSK